MECMSDARHKKSPPPADLEEDVTPAFRELARGIMRTNALTNKMHGWTPGHRERLIENDVELAVVVIGNKDGKTQIGNILGPVKPTTKARGLVDRSTFVQKIRVALKMDEPIPISVDPRRAPAMAWISGLSDKDFAVFDNAFRAAIRKPSSNPR